MTNFDRQNVTVIDGKTNTVTVAVGLSLGLVAVNPERKKYTWEIEATLA